MFGSDLSSHAMRSFILGSAIDISFVLGSMLGSVLGLHAQAP